jgi:hypothetical protein
MGNIVGTLEIARGMLLNAWETKLRSKLGQFYNNDE